MRNIIVDTPTTTGTINIACDTLDIWTALSLRLPESLLDACYLAHITSLSEADDLYVRLSLRIHGGKGGFGSQLRAAGGRNKGNKKANTEAMKDTSGRRLRTLKQAQALAEALRDAPEREKAERKAKRDKLLGIINTELPGRGGRQAKFEDEDYIAQSESILEDIRAAMNGVDESSSSDETTDEGHFDVRGSAIKQAIESGSTSRSTGVPRTLGIWDEDDEDSGDNSDEEDDEADATTQTSGKTADKGKGRATDQMPSTKKRKTAK